MRFAAATVALALATLAQAAEVKSTRVGKVIGVTDGDTIKVLIGERPFNVRLEGIDAPEKGQPFGRAAKKRLSELCFGKTVELRATKKDRYGRIVCSVLVGGAEANEQLVREGLAWHYKRFNDERRYADAEEQARALRIGLWSDAHPILPWEWRKLSARERAAIVSGRRAPAVEPEKITANENAAELTHWLNTKSDVRHNSSCRWFGTTKHGRKCTCEEGMACSQCGG